MTNTLKAVRRILKASITRIALCKSPVNQLGVLVKSQSDASPFSIAGFAKAGIEGTLIGVVYAPELPDSEGDVASAEVIKEAAWDYLRHSRALEIEHFGAVLAPEKVSVVESFIVSKAGDARLDSILPRDKQPGAWAVVLKIDDPALKTAVANGDIAGLSMFGDALFERVTKSQPEPESDTMNEIQMAALVKSIADATALAVSTSLANAEAARVAKAQADAEAEAARVAKAQADAAAAEAANTPTFDGDPTDEAALDKFEAVLKAHAMRTALAKAKTPQEVAEIRKSFAPKDAPGSGVGVLSKAAEDALIGAFIKGTLTAPPKESFTVIG